MYNKRIGLDLFLFFFSLTIQLLLTSEFVQVCEPRIIEFINVIMFILFLFLIESKQCNA